MDIALQAEARNHRLSTIRRVNKILVIEDGHVAEFGTPEELLSRGGYYARVMAGQSELTQ